MRLCYQPLAAPHLPWPPHSLTAGHDKGWGLHRAPSAASQPALLFLPRRYTAEVPPQRAGSGAEPQAFEGSPRSHSRLLSPQCAPSTPTKQHASTALLDENREVLQALYSQLWGCVESCPCTGCPHYAITQLVAGARNCLSSSLLQALPG